jgi:CPA2 family monovalent cation:H+ antiporter-2
VLLFRYPLNTALTVAASLAQIGEFSFILAGLGVFAGLLPPEAMSLVLAGALISIALNAAVFAAVEPLRQWVLSRSALARRLEERDDPLAQLPMSTDLRLLSGQVVLVGHGRVGRRIAAMLRADGIAVVVVEQNREAVDALRRDGVPAVVGDASEPEVLIQAHIARAAMLVVAVPDTLNVRGMVETARMLNPGLQVVLRTHNEEEAVLLQQDTDGTVFLGEHELARGMGEHIRQRLRERARLPVRTARQAP